ncbi:MAG: hypothetical protein GF364_19345 [Candidatus Lokiarchaeota archaeon]|nr:hypothetical protein [Candidatus Lokiarchaeota archaeon]
MLNVEYPLSGTGPEISFGLEVILVYISFQMFGVFIYRYLTSTFKEQNLRNLAWSMIFLGYGITYIFYIIADYFINPAVRDYFSQYGYISLTSGITLYALLSEYIEKSKWYPVTIFCGTFLVLSIISLILGHRDMTLNLAFLAVPFAAVYILRYFYKYAKITNFNKRVLGKIAGLFLSMLIILAGYFFVSDAMTARFGPDIRVLSASLNIIGVICFMFAILNLPDYREFVWKQHLRALFIVRTSGILLFNRFWKRENKENSNEYLIGGALSSIQTVLSNITEETSINRMELEDKALLFKMYPDKDVVGCIIADEYIDSLNERLNVFLDRFDVMFGGSLKDWDGNTQVFLPLESICDEVFMEKPQTD